MIPLIAQLEFLLSTDNPIWWNAIILFTIFLLAFVGFLKVRENGRIKNENDRIRNENEAIKNERAKTDSHNKSIEKFFEVIVAQNVESSERERRHDTVYESLGRAIENSNQIANEHKSIASALITKVDTVQVGVEKNRLKMDDTHIKIKTLDDTMRDTRRDVSMAIEQIKAMILAYQSDVTEAQEMSSVAQDRRLQRILDVLIVLKDTMAEQLQPIPLTLVTPVDTSTDNTKSIENELEKEPI